MTRILWLTPNKPADISVGRRRIADHLEREGIDVTLRGTTLATAARSFRERDRYDAIVGTTRAGALVGATIRLAGGPPLVVDHVDPIEQFVETAPVPLGLAVRILEDVSFGVADHVLYVYDEETSRVTKRATAYTRTDLGVDYDRFVDPAPEAIEHARELLGQYKLRDDVAVYVGGLEPIYHVEELLAAFDHLEGWSLVIAGAGSLRSTVERAADGREIIYLGTVDHGTVPGLLRAADVGVCLVNDAHTLKTLEYGAAGLPIVQVCGDAEERFGDMMTYCDPEAHSVAAAIQQAAARNGEQLGDYVRQYDWEKIAETYRNVLVRAADGASKP
jgi:glycosyltransferase involved in cell wall biosynthesis